MNRCMVDLETLGTKPGCVILSIGAVFFDETTRKLGPTFYATINQNSCKRFGLKIDVDTQKWWNEQCEEARQVVMSTLIGGHELDAALRQFKTWMETVQYEHWLYTHLDQGRPQPKDWLADVEVWGCGAAFDNTILAAAYTATGMPLPWKFWNDRCYRTLKALYPVHKLARVGTHHNALDDAKSQAHHAIALLRAARQLPEPTWGQRMHGWWQRVKEEWAYV